MVWIKQFQWNSIVRRFTQNTSFDKIGTKVLNAYGLGIAVSCNYYMYDDATKNKKKNLGV